MHNVQTIIIIAGVCCIATCGCRDRMSTASLSDYSYVANDRPVEKVGRIALIELDHDLPHAQVASDVTNALFEALQKKRVFGLNVVAQDSAAMKSLQLDHTGAYTLEQLSALRQTFQCDAVMTGRITVYKPYPHLCLGLRLKLIDLADGQLVWAMEYVWDTTDTATKDRIRAYYSDAAPFRPGSIEERLGTVSQLKFLKFVAYETSRTLHARSRIDRRSRNISTYNF